MTGSAGPPGTAPPTVLLLDDEQDLLTLLTLVLERGGARVFATADGRQALRFLRAEQIDVALVDLLMPGMSGSEFLTEVRRLDAARRPSVLIVSALSPEAVARELGAPADAGYTLLGKPFELGQIEGIVAQAAAERAAARG